MEQARLTQIIEALLFSSNRALNVQQISKTLEIEDRNAIRQAVATLNDFYEESNRAFHVQEVAEGYLLTTKAEYQSWVQNAKVQKPVSLSPSSMETLSIIAYKQPITRAEVDEIRGVDCSYAVRSMLDKGMLRILGKKDAPGRPMLYGTSKLFLEIFGFKTLKDLPRPEEFDLFENETEDGLTHEEGSQEGITLEGYERTDLDPATIDTETINRETVEGHAEEVDSEIEEAIETEVETETEEAVLLQIEDQENKEDQEEQAERQEEEHEEE